MDPSTKEEFVNKLLSRDFDGDLSKLGDLAQVVRISSNKLMLIFPITKQTYELTVRKPREETSTRVLQSAARLRA